MSSCHYYDEDVKRKKFTSTSVWVSKIRKKNYNLLYSSQMLIVRKSTLQVIIKNL